jgi:hypothetical protein
MAYDGLSARCPNPNCKGLTKGKAGIVTNRGRYGEYAACRQCARVYEPLTKKNQVPILRKK